MVVEERKQISYGVLVSRADFEKNPFIPEKVKKALKESPYYLNIFIPSDEILKVSLFPVKNRDIKKVLIRLKEFSPELVKGISEVLKNFNLGQSTIHTTGLCFESINCFYETYIDGTSFTQKNLSWDKIVDEFNKVPRVEEVKIIDITVLTI